MFTSIKTIIYNVTITYGILITNNTSKTSNNIIHHKQLLADTNQCDVTIRFLCGFETMVLLSRRSEEIVFFVELGDFAHSSLPV